MAKKSSKSSRRTRAKKEQTKQQQTTTTKKVEAPKVAKPPVVAATPPSSDEIQFVVEDVVQPQRKRMLISACMLVVVLVGLIFVAGTMRQPTGSRQEVVKSGGDSSKADEILQSGGNVCTNGSTQTNTQGSANPESVGMMLQNVPANSIQTPQTVTPGNDASVLQGAACF